MVRFIFFGRVLSKHKQAQIQNAKINLHSQGYKGTSKCTGTVFESPWPPGSWGGQSGTEHSPLPAQSFLGLQGATVNAEWKRKKYSFTLTPSASSPETETGSPLERENRKEPLRWSEREVISQNHASAFRIRLPSYGTEEAPFTPTSVTNTMFYKNWLFFSVPHHFNKTSRAWCYA